MTPSARWCVLGLGNPGTKYLEDRHNAGCRCVAQLASELGLRWRTARKFDYGATPSGLVVCRPKVFINQSGELWPLLRRQWLLDSRRLIVVVDHLDLPPGALRFRMQGGSAGHNGLRSLVAWVGSGEFCRIYLGIGHPGSRDLVVPHVLGSPPPAERQLIAQATDRVVAALCTWDGQSAHTLAQTLAEG